MRIRLLAFATASDALGGGEHQIELRDGSTVADLARLLKQRHPSLESLWPRLAIAVDGEMVTESAALSEGVEVALLPPVSGGAPAMRTRLVEEDIDLRDLLSSAADPSCGALVLFVGTVRDRHRDRPVNGITYDAYRAMASGKLEAIAEELERSAEGLRVRMVHRLGEIPAGEASVAIAVASPHRAAAYDANRRALERLKTEVPIWKLEHYADGEARWREEEPLR